MAGVTAVAAVCLFGLLSLVAVFLGRAVVRHPIIGFAVIGAQVLLLWEFPDSISVAAFAGLNITLQDVTCVLLLIAATMNLSTCRPRQWGYKELSLLAVLLLFSLLSGIFIKGIQPAINEGRFIFPAAITFFWSTTLPWASADFQRRTITFASVLATLLVAVGLWHGAVYGWQSAVSQTVLSVTGDEQTGRPLVSIQALVLALCTVVLVGVFLHRPSFWSGVGVLGFCVTIVAVQQRSVWLAGGAAVLAVIVSGSRRSLGRSLFIGGILIWLVSISVLSGVAEFILGDLSAAASSTVTLEARSAGWNILVEEAVARGPLSVLVGTPLGTGYYRFDPITSQYVGFQPHNWYVTLFLRAGIAGLLAYVGLLMLVTVRLLQMSRGSVRAIALAAIAMLAVYGWTYGLPWEFGVVLGAAFAISRSKVETQMSTREANDRARFTASVDGAQGRKESILT